jgi:hypothetical protein
MRILPLFFAICLVTGCAAGTNTRLTDAYFVIVPVVKKAVAPPVLNKVLETEPCRQQCQGGEEICRAAIKKTRTKMRLAYFNQQFVEGVDHSMCLAGLEDEFLALYEHAPPVDRCHQHDVGRTLVKDVAAWHQQCDSNPTAWWCDGVDLWEDGSITYHLALVEFRGRCDGQKLRKIPPLRL